MKKQFFVSYNGRDKQWAEWIAWILEEAGYSVIIQAWDFRPGSNFVLKMQNATVQAEKTLAVLSNNYLNALYTHPEWAAAFAQDPTGQKRTLIPIRVSECEIKGLLQQIVYADVVNLSEAEAKDVVLAALQERAKPTQAPGFPGVSLLLAERITPQRVDYPGAEVPHNLAKARTGAVNFVAREDAMVQLHHQLQQQERIAITAVVTGMAGVGKTELVRQFFQAKLALREDADELKRSFCRGMVEEAKTIPENPTKEQVEAVALSIPHIEESATELEQWLEEEDLISPFERLGVFYYGQGLYEQTEPWCKQCLEVTHRRLGEEHPDVAQSLNNLAYLYESQGRYKEAEPLYLEALDLTKRLLGDNHPDVAQSLNNLALLYNSQGRYKEAEPLYLQALKLRKRLLGENHPDVASSINNLAALYRSQGRYSEAEPLYLQALELRKRLLGDNHPDLATSLNNLAQLYKSQGKYEEAEPLYLQALAIVEQVLGENHPTTVRIRENLESLP
ncbi:toll/interleukin-1 receptor domain-containing protein [Microcystis aeruginosa]|nr:toll/interleukin-1 receptor domain-containing protein [Microcystis aeruginosa]